MEVVNKIIMLPVASIKPYHRNVRHNRETIDKLCALIPKVGFNVPLVLDKNNVIVKGHTRWAAAIRLGMTELPCVYSNADEETLKLDRIADNKVQEFSRWDTEALLSELTSISLDFDFSILDLDIAIPAVEIPQWELSPKVPEKPPVAHDSGEPILEAAVPHICTETPQESTPFITQEDVEKTLPVMMSKYHEIMCDKCGNRMFIRK